MLLFLILIVHAYTLVPGGVCVGDQVAIRIERLGSRVRRFVWHRGDGSRFGRWFDDLLIEVGSVFLFRSGWRWRGSGRSSFLLFAVEGTDLQLAFVLLQDALVVIFPELFGSVLAANTLEDCRCQDDRVQWFGWTLLLFWPPKIN